MCTSTSHDRLLVAIIKSEGENLIGLYCNLKLEFRYDIHLQARNSSLRRRNFDKLSPKNQININ